MKKTLFLFIPTLLLISACDFHVNLVNREESAGFYKNGSPVSAMISNYEYSYTPNNSYDVASLNKASLKFKGITTSESELTSFDLIAPLFDIDNPNFILSIEGKPVHFGTKRDGFAFLGNDYDDSYGEITFVSNFSIKNVFIKCKPYFYLSTAYENEVVVDQDVAISVNNSGFIKLDEAVIAEDTVTNTTTCQFALNEPSDRIQIRTGKKRVILEEIIFYY